jgi:hypothetical protein
VKRDRKPVRRHRCCEGRQYLGRGQGAPGAFFEIGQIDGRHQIAAIGFEEVVQARRRLVGVAGEVGSSRRGQSERATGRGIRFDGAQLIEGGR